MKEATAKRLMRAAKRLGYVGKHCDRDERVTLQKAYSGRGMFGKTTFAVCVPSASYLAMLGAAAYVKRAEREEFARELGKLREDSLGLGIVIY
jgi:hypothetical protein